MAVNWWAIVVAAAVKFLIGWGWYAPPVFGKRWQELSQVSPGQMGWGLAVPLGLQVIGDLIMAYILARFIEHYAIGGIGGGILIGFMAWLGFVATVMVGSIFYEKKPPMLIVINGGYQLVGIVAMGAILGAWP